MPLSVKDAAELLGVHANTVYREIEKGELTAYKFGGAIRIDEEDLQRYKEQQKIAPAPKAGKNKRDRLVWKPGMRVMQVL